MYESSKNFISLIKEIDETYRTEKQRDRGTRFELLAKAYFKTEPMYQRLYEDVWMLSDVPEEYNIPKNDTGVDLVAKERETGELVAIQAKYYGEDKTIQKSDIDSFLNEVGKKYYSKGIVITTTDKWGRNAEDALLERDKVISRISLTQLKDSQVDWTAFKFSSPEQTKVKRKKSPRTHQIPAIKAVLDGFKTVDRGKLIMAPGTGKTYTSMAIAEEMAKEKDGVFRVLYLVPSIQLLSQTLRGWTADTNYQMDAIAVCSDKKVTKKESKNEFEDITVADIGFPATTSKEKLLEYQSKIDTSNSKGNFLTVFSTYQSIDVIIEAQKEGFYEFDLVVCDEAHRTTGSTEVGKEDSSFTKVHYDDNIKTAKRLYQTATPRVYGDAAKQKAQELSVVIADMDNPKLYGEEFYRIGFGDAISQGILTDYKVMVLAVDEEMIARQFQQMLANKDSELEFDDITKIIGCWNGLVRRANNSDVALGAPMKRAIAFTGTIRESKLITDMFGHVVNQYLYQDIEEHEKQYNIEIDHADGSMNALQKNKKISWLKDDVPEQTCRILSNARFLTEGVDVPDLDAIMFLKPRKSKIDIAQAVGRVMRKSPGKDYGYVILPIGVPAGSDANSLLDNNEKYRVVWEVLNALRSLDERFDATINKLELNKKKPGQISVIGVGEAPEDGKLVQQTDQLALMFNEEDVSDLERAIYGKIVQKVGNVRYWEDWSKDVAEIAQQHMLRIRVMLEDETSEAFKEFQKFIKSLRYNINDSISETQAIEMLAQHLITKPVFEALFDSYSFVMNNPVSKSMDKILSILDDKGLMKEQERLESFYESVRVRADGIDNLKAKQDIIVQLYDKFFKVGFKETTERLGIVFTPTEVVDFIIHSVDDVLKKHFGKSLASEGVHVLDPFTGTGTFVTRLLQSGLIPKEDLLRKYTQEIHANEIVLLSYYIAAVNIEETFHSLNGGEYVPFEGIVLTDTFESTEYKDSFMDELFDENNARLKKQQEEPIFALVGNPPYSKGQKDENDKNKNIVYPKLDHIISQTYVKNSKSNSVLGMYDSYVRAIRWASNRIENKGVVGFVSNGSFIESISSDGLRKSLFDEFNSLYIFNLRGDARTSGEKRRKEAGNVFGSGSRNTIAIYVLVKDKSGNHDIFYNDIGDYLSRDEKLDIISSYKSINNLEWIKLLPDKNNDWLSQRDEAYLNFYPISDSSNSIFNLRDLGVVTNRDAWVTNFSKNSLKKNVESMLDNYNMQVEQKQLDAQITLKNVDDFIDTNQTKISWSRSLKQKYIKGEKSAFDSESVIVGLYRPFTKKYYYRNRFLNENVRKSYTTFPKSDSKNLLLNISGAGAKTGFSALVSDKVTFMDALNKSRNFPLNIYQEESIFIDKENNITDEFERKIGMDKEDAFLYIYAILHHKEYVKRFENDLLKDLPRIPIAKKPMEFVDFGKRLVELHLNYEELPLYDQLEIEIKPNASYKVKKMKHPKKNEKNTIIFNSDITIKNIPSRAYEYIINGKSPVEWVMDQYQVKIDSKSKIIDDPNEYSDDEKYVFNLVLKTINVAIQTLDIIDILSVLEFE